VKSDTPSTSRSMKTNRRRIRLVGSLAVVVIVSVAACGSSSTSSSSTTTVSGKNVAVETPDGQASLSLNGQLPPNWPAGFPVPNGATPAGSGSLVNGGTGVMTGVYTTTQPPADVYNFYKSNPSLTITKSGSVGTGDKYVGTLELGGTYPGNTTIVAAGNGTNIVVTLKGGSSTATTA
jgi:hypothetical protein